MVSQFRSDLLFKDPGGFPFVLTQSLIYDSCLLNATLVIPAGFKTDLASIPQLLWNILPPIGAYDGAAVVHDFLYAGGAVKKRRTADQILREAMEVLHVIEWKRTAIYTGVRLGGWVKWHEYRRS